MSRILSALLIALLFSIPAQAFEFETAGIGGGGWLQSGTFHPTDPDVMLVGTDITGGIFRSDDGGYNWGPWNDGIPNDDEARTNYIEDLIGIQEGSKAVFYAATQGGIFRREDLGSAWEWETPAADYCYNLLDDAGYPDLAAPIPFSTLAWDGDQTLYAGAGRIRWETTNQTSYYPGLEEIHKSAFPGVTAELESTQFPVWERDLGPSGVWQPVTVLSELSGGVVGAVQDMSFATIPMPRGRDKEYLVVATAEGVWLYSPQTQALQSLWDLPVKIPVDNGDHFFSEELRPWSLHLTKRGTLYIAVERADASVALPSGAYMIPDITQPARKLEWSWVGNNEQLVWGGDPTAWDGSLYDLGCGGVLLDFLFLTVIEGEGVEDDILLLGERRESRKGLLRGRQPVVVGDRFTCSWEPKIYRKKWVVDRTTIYCADENGDEHVFDHGWDEIRGAAVLFHPAVSPADPDRILIQIQDRLHVSENGGDDWRLSNTRPAGDGWVTRGYDELCVSSLDFESSGHSVYAVNDIGAFRSLNQDQTLFVPFNPVVNDFDNPPTGENDVGWMFGVQGLQVQADYGEPGQDAIFINYSTYKSPPSKPGKLFRYLETGEPPWRNVTGTFAASGCGPLENFVFENFIVLDDGTIYLAYRRYSDALGTAGVVFEEAGVMRGDLDPESLEYTWAPCNEGLLVTNPLDQSSNALGIDFIYHAPSGRVFMAAKSTNVILAGENFQVKGGVFTRAHPDGAEWVRVIGGYEDGVATPYNDFRCLAQSTNGEVIYGGVRGRSMTGSGGGSVLRFTGSDGGAPHGSLDDLCAPLANTVEDPETFSFTAPFWADALGYTHSSFANSPGKWLTDVRSLAVDPRHPDVVYMGMVSVGFMAQGGLWRGQVTDVDGVVSCGWVHLSEGEVFEGISVPVVRFNPHVEGQLLFGTTGQGAYKVGGVPDPGDPGVDPHDPPGEDPLSVEGTIRRPDGISIAFSLAIPGPVTVEIFDLNGRLVHRQASESLPAGMHEVTWNRRDRRGLAVASGVYFARITGPDQAEAAAKLVVVR